MVSLNKAEANEITKVLSKTKDRKLKKIIRKLNAHQERLIYIYEQKEIKPLLRSAFKEKKKVKISYYSLSSDQVTSRVIDIYQLHDDCIVAYCNLRKEERTFVIRRINRAAMLNESYKIPKCWTPESIVHN